MRNLFIRKILEITENNIGNPHFGVAELAREANISYSSLRRRVLSYTGKPANELIREIRLKKALEILREEQVTAAEAAHRTGFSSTAYFSTCFHQYYGYPPGEFRRLDEETVKEIEEARAERNRDGPQRAGSLIAFLGRKRMKRLGAYALLMVILLASIHVAATWVKKKPDEKSIAVLPVKNLNRDEQTQKFCESLQEQLQNEISGIRNLKVRSRISADQYKNPESRLPQIGKELDADLILTCAVAVDQEEYSVSVQLTESESDLTLWAKTFRRHRGQFFLLQDEVVNFIMQEIQAFLRNDPNPDKPTS